MLYPYLEFVVWVRADVAFVEATAVIGQLLLDPRSYENCKENSTLAEGIWCRLQDCRLGEYSTEKRDLFRTGYSVFLFCHLLAELGVNRLLPTTG